MFVAKQICTFTYYLDVHYNKTRKKIIVQREGSANTGTEVIESNKIFMDIQCVTIIQKGIVAYIQMQDTLVDCLMIIAGRKLVVEKSWGGLMNLATDWKKLVLWLDILVLMDHNLLPEG